MQQSIVLKSKKCPKIVFRATFKRIKGWRSQMQLGSTRVIYLAMFDYFSVFSL
ncbi:hypothetical protein FDUTEX481_00456 [Tolypothrix sp. PCC 7601]|nr:hypothetical protein FDUTEX481_00456 [Tolypothrix sp. PCC 7601]